MNFFRLVGKCLSSFFSYDCGMMIIKYMELWDGSWRFNGKNMPEYSTVRSFDF